MLDKKLEQESVTIEGETYTFSEILMIDQHNLNQAFSTQAARYTYFAFLAAKAEANYNEAKTLREQTYADVELWVRAELAKDPNIKVTEGLIKSQVAVDDKYLNTVDDENKALHDWKVMRALVDGLKMRSEMLISLGATMRQEYEMTDMKILSTKEKMKELRG